MLRNPFKVIEVVGGGARTETPEIWPWSLNLWPSWLLPLWVFTYLWWTTALQKKFSSQKQRPLLVVIFVPSFKKAQAISFQDTKNLWGKLIVPMLETDEILLISPSLIWFGVFLSRKTSANHKSDRALCSRCIAFIIIVLQGFTNLDLGLQTKLPEKFTADCHPHIFMSWLLQQFLLKILTLIPWLQFKNTICALSIYKNCLYSEITNAIFGSSCFHIFSIWFGNILNRSIS